MERPISEEGIVTETIEEMTRVIIRKGLAEARNRAIESCVAVFWEMAAETSMLHRRHAEPIVAAMRAMKVTTDGQGWPVVARPAAKEIGRFVVAGDLGLEEKRD